MIDASTDTGAHALERLQTERIAWSPDPPAPAPKDHPGYLAKYADLLASCRLTAESVSVEFPRPYGIGPTVVRVF
jgi:hypothetical protein